MIMKIFQNNFKFVINKTSNKFNFLTYKNLFQNCNLFLTNLDFSF